MTFGISKGKFEVARRVGAHVVACRQTSFNLPVVVDFSRGEQTELELIFGFLSVAAASDVFFVAVVAVTEFARPRDFVVISPEFVGSFNEDAESFEFASEFCRQSVDVGFERRS